MEFGKKYLASTHQTATTIASGARRQHCPADTLLNLTNGAVVIIC